jgi:hypothetical protein
MVARTRLNVRTLPVLFYELRTLSTIALAAAKCSVVAVLSLGYARDWLSADSFVARAWAMVLNGSAHTVRHVRGKIKLSSSSADSPRQLCVRAVGRLEK